MINRFGTNSDMIIQTVEEQGSTYYLAIDSKGLYLTTKERLDTQLADPNRFSTLRRGVAARLSSLGLDPTALQTANQHLIRVASADIKKVNPLKASKRKMKSA
ncbi:hypothetical protein LJC48_03085 [Desulfovibrio sp. OttesenSCG-928-C06]|nr:hypothetical protein [Desulfovibrio sp. OttesenSCG-928-C06]